MKLTQRHTYRVSVMAMLATLIVLASPGPSKAGPTSKKKWPDIYDTKADGNKQIAEALKVAKRENKRVLLQFGANWCPWCHLLHDLFKEDREIARKLLYEYVVVLIDVDKVDGKEHNADVNKRYGGPKKHGLPVLVVLAADGKQLVTQETGALEEGDHHAPSKVLAFLEKWQAEPVSADTTLARGIDRAKAESKSVFVYFSAPWCRWCHKLDEYLRQPAIANIFNSAFVPVKIDVDRMTGGKEMDKRTRGDAKPGIPFFAVLDASGKKLADSNDPDLGNLGCPYTPEEVALFMKLLRRTAPKLTDADIATLRAGLGPQEKDKTE